MPINLKKLLRSVKMGDPTAVDVSFQAHLTLHRPHIRLQILQVFLTQVVKHPLITEVADGNVFGTD